MQYVLWMGRVDHGGEPKLDELATVLAGPHHGELSERILTGLPGLTDRMAAIVVSLAEEALQVNHIDNSKTY